MGFAMPDAYGSIPPRPFFGMRILCDLVVVQVDGGAMVLFPVVHRRCCVGRFAIVWH